MSSPLRSILCGVAVALSHVLTVGAVAGAQTLFLKGQTIQPVYEGWEKNRMAPSACCSGHLNRNYEETRTFL